MFCKKCGSEIKEGAKFCSKCGTPVSEKNPVQKENGVSLKNNKWIIPATVVALVWGVFTAKGLFSSNDSHEKVSETAKVKTEKRQTEDELKKVEQTEDAQEEQTMIADTAEDNYDENSSGKLVEEVINGTDVAEELRQAYLDGYNDEKEMSDVMIYSYFQNKDQDNQNEFLNSTGEAWQALQEAAPEIKEVLIEEADYYIGSDPLTSYLTRGALGTALGDSEIGKEVREYTGVLTYQLANWVMAEMSVSARANALVPIYLGEEYSIYRSYGNINSILDLIGNDIGYTSAKEALEARQNALYEMYTFEILTVDWIPDYKGVTFTEQSLADEKERLNVQGRETALGEIVGEWDDYYEAVCDSLKDWLKVDESNYSQYLYYIRDKEEKIVTIFMLPWTNVEMIMNSEGMFSVSPITYSGLWGAQGINFENNETDFEVPVRAILNKAGKVLYENYFSESELDKSVMYSPVTTSGNLLKITFHSDFENGDYQKVYLLDKEKKETFLFSGKGIEISSLEEGNSGSLCSDYLKLQVEEVMEGTVNIEELFNEKSTIVDVSTGKTYTEESWNKLVSSNKNADSETSYPGAKQGDSVWIYVEAEDTDSQSEYERISGIRLNNQYFAETENNGNSITGMIYDYEGNLAGDLSDGNGIRNIRYADGKYRIVTNTGWYYIVDDKFEKVLEPVDRNLENENEYWLGDYGLLYYERLPSAEVTHSEKYAIKKVNDKGEEELICKSKEPNKMMRYYQLDDYIIGDEYNGWYDLRLESGNNAITTEYPEDITPICYDNWSAADDTYDTYDADDEYIDDEYLDEYADE